MSLEQSIDKLTAAVEAMTGVLVTQGAAANKSAPAASAPPPAARGAGRPAKTAAAPPPVDEGLGGDDDSGLGGDDGGLGADDGGDAPVKAEEAKAAVIAYRDKATKLKGAEEGLALTRSLMKKHVAALADINNENAPEIHKVFTAALSKLK